MEHQSVFRGLKVVELASVLAGPAVGMFFAELGAEVVKIENKTTGGDVTRGWKLPSENPSSPVSAYWSSVNWGKKHLFLDLNTPSDHAEAWRTVLAADVLISNLKPAAALRLGFDPDTLRAQNPRLIYAQLDAFPDPEDDSPAFDAVLQAEAGFMFMTGERGRPAAKMPVALIDLLAAHQLKEAILTALLRRENSGEGSLVRCSLLESAIASLANQASNYLMNGHVPQRMGTQHPNIAPYGDTFTCSDGQTILLAVGTERQFAQLCVALSLEMLLQDPDFSTNAARVRHRERLNQILSKKLAGRSLAENLATLRSFKVPVAQIRDMASVFEMPEARAMVLEETAPDGTLTKRVRTIAFKMS